MSHESPFTTKPSPLWGGLRWVQPRKIAGWAYAPRRPEEHLHVEIRLDGALVATACADEPYEQLARSGICAAGHGFVADTEASLPPDRPDRIEATAVGSLGERLRLYLPGDKPAANGALTRRRLRFTAADTEASPVLVLGAARSGTSAMGRALRCTGRFAGHGEGHLLPLLGKLLQTTRAHYLHEGKAASPGAFTMLAGVPEPVMEEGLQALFVRIARAQFPTGQWMEKTPGAEMILLAPLIARIWPRARFIFLQRRAIENIESRRRKFADLPFAQHCRNWAEAMEAWQAVRPALADRALEVEHQEMALQPVATSTRIGAFLALAAEQTVLLGQSLAGDRPQRTDARFGMVLDYAALDWPQEDRASFQAICGPAMEQAGYVEGPAYRASGLLPAAPAAELAHG